MAFSHPDLIVRFADVTDGTSNTVMIGEHPPGPQGLYGGWYANWGNCTCPVAQIRSVWEGARLVGGPECPPLKALAPGRIEDPCSASHYWSLHPGGANFGFADGSVRFLRYEANDILPALATRAGGEAVSPPE
jgi:prepilin-type processing-associated H-X9-DG protein